MNKYEIEIGLLFPYCFDNQNKLLILKNKKK